MSRDEVRSLTERVAVLARRLAAEPRLQAELLRARRQFFGLESGEAENDAAEHRFVEWYLLERESESLGAVPATVPPYEHEATELQGSMVGAYLVLSTEPAVTARDLEDESVVELEVEVDALRAGDLLVGRLYPGGGERWLPSVAAPVLRPGRDIAAAFVRDVQRLALARRLQQAELEHLLLRQNHSTAIDGMTAGKPEPATAPLEHLEADLEKLLRTGGVQHAATAISQQLADSDHPGELIGPLLDELAFETDVDLDRTRRLLLEIWNVQHVGRERSTEDATDSPSSGPPGESLGERLVRTLDEGLGEKRNVEDLFAQLEQMAGIEAEPDDELDDDDTDQDPIDVSEPGEVVTGDLLPLVTEFLWETERGEDPTAVHLNLWVELQRNAPVPRADFDSIAAADLMRLLLHVYLGAAPSERAASVRATFAQLRDFYDWVAVAHEIDRRSVLQECRGALLDQLDRLQAAGVLLSTAETPLRRPGLLQIEDLGDDGFGARDDDGGHHWLLADAATTGNLQVGDLVLGALAPADPDAVATGRQLQGLVVVLPIDARSMIE